VTQERLRSQMGMLPPDPVLFPLYTKRWFVNMIFWNKCRPFVKRNKNLMFSVFFTPENFLSISLTIFPSPHLPEKKVKIT
jgi:hypothetical protein